MAEINFLKEFILDANEQFDKIERAVLNLEKKFSKDYIDELFRAFHTLKGNSTIVGMLEVRDLSHAVESMVTDVKNDVITMSAEITDLVLSSVDVIKRHLKDAEDGNVGHEHVDASPLLEKIRKIRQNPTQAVGEAAQQPKLIIKTTDNLAILEIPYIFEEGYAHDMLEYLLSLRKRGIIRYIFNFRDTNSISSSGVSALATTRKRMERCGAKTVSCAMSPLVKKAFEDAGKGSEMNIKTTLREAVGVV
ncbi:MAG: hypothetical protein IEMM0002_0367 [bacterium]|nr:MAG: hypothetical protein IEMM0002_0367 [bacterium]